MITVVVGLLGALVAGWGWYRAHLAGDRADAMQRERDAVKAALAGWVADCARLESAIAGHRAELASLEEALRACDDPVAVRARLRELLGGRPAAGAAQVG